MLVWYSLTFSHLVVVLAAMHSFFFTPVPLCRALSCCYTQTCNVKVFIDVLYTPVLKLLTACISMMYTLVCVSVRLCLSAHLLACFVCFACIIKGLGSHRNRCFHFPPWWQHVTQCFIVFISVFL